MSDPAAFEILAEISIGLIGFAGVVVAIGATSLDGVEQRVRLRLLFLNGVVALWGGLSPSLAYQAVGEDFWRLSGLLFLIAYCGIVAYAYQLTFRRYGTQVGPAMGVSIAIAVTLILEIIYLVVSLIWLPEQIPAAQYLGVLQLLFLGLYHFFSLAMGRDDRDMG